MISVWNNYLIYNESPENVKYNDLKLLKLEREVIWLSKSKETYTIIGDKVFESGPSKFCGRHL